ncbi:MAG: sigma-70 family RNA polymerase sigma factor [bacterium]|nr:sigma-70 family RNA polymerase sigma factor [bacterium]
MTCSDERLFARVQQDDRGAFGLLVQRYQNRVYSMALKVLHHQHDAEDASQQAFLQVWQKRRLYNPKWHFNTWLYRIVANVCIDEYRRCRRRRPAPDTLLASLPAPHSPAQDYEQQERCRMLTEALQCVPVEARMVLILYYMEGCSYAEIANIRGISVHTVKSQLRRAKTLLRQRLNPSNEATS